MHTTLFEIFKISIGPSSSHTVGPMRAAKKFVESLGERRLLLATSRVQVELYGSLALTGRGHGTDRAVILGLCGQDPETVDIATIDVQLSTIREMRTLSLRGNHTIEFIEPRDLLFYKDQRLPGHTNGMRFRAFDHTGGQLAQQVYYSIGGGFIVREGDERQGEADGRGAGFLLENPALKKVPYPFASAEELLRIGAQRGMAVWHIVLENENAFHSEENIRKYVLRVWDTMHQCVLRGLQTEGILPGGLNVRRRAAKLARSLEKDGERRREAGEKEDPLHAMDWVNVFAMAVNEENAARGRVVTAPTNGAAGVIPAVAHYYETFIPGASPEGLFHFFLTAAAVGVLYKENASISGAEVGCQGEVGLRLGGSVGGGDNSERA